jgi:DNA-binding NarL/FixJ family response regulator
VRRHVGALLKLLGVDNRVSLAVTAIREGWVG